MSRNSTSSPATECRLACSPSWGPRKARAQAGRGRFECTLAALTEAELRASGLGFRAAKLLATARRFAAGEINESQLRSAPRSDAERALRGLPGVGPKVANCVLLFALEHLDAFPIDVWIERVLRERYFRGKRRVTARRLREFSQDHFGPYGGYAQQYLFHHARTNRRGA